MPEKMTNKQWMSHAYLALYQNIVAFIFLCFNFCIDWRNCIIDIMDFLGQSGYIMTRFVHIFLRIVHFLFLFILFGFELFNFCFILINSGPLLFFILFAFLEGIFFIGYYTLPSLDIYCNLFYCIIIIVPYQIGQCKIGDNKWNRKITLSIFCSFEI